MEKINTVECEQDVKKSQEQIKQEYVTALEEGDVIKRFVITTRSFREEGFFLENSFEKVINDEIINSQWRKISLPIYLLDFLSDIGFDVVKNELKKYNDTLMLFNEFNASISQLLVKESEIDSSEIQTVYSYADNLILSLAKIILKDSKTNSTFKEALSSNSNILSETVKYKLDDLIFYNCEGGESLFYCYWCKNIEDIRALSGGTVECYVIRSFNRKLSKKLGEEYMNSLLSFFGLNANFIIHDYDYGVKLLQGDFVYKSDEQDHYRANVLLFKHNKGDVYQILKNGSFSLLYLYVIKGCILKYKVQFLISLLDRVLCGLKIFNEVSSCKNITQVSQNVMERIAHVRKACDEIINIRDKCLNNKDRIKIEQSLNKLRDCLNIEVSLYYDLYKLMFNLMELDDYVLCNIKD